MECQFKALARALRYASEHDPRAAGTALHEGRPVTGLSTILIVVGLFLAGGVYSFSKQGMPKGVIVLLSIGSVMCLVVGILRIQGLVGLRADGP
ncbi:hypothetical protein SCALM49S_02032 [Streptomyces californicus]